ncbi:type II toxin-antitoxin system VapC family toxin [Calothrix sp. PCC 6303]|uniref:type II toxin-antitoxin system VapC family toxin n=1 Tax=Calothrix sp. PCC 6303 TaxID=1170562 RepID=UPI001EF075EB|nr:type II toxin-antitoxin system VapC family toxin [Calothrix sp. PCC 6303]
MMKYLFDSNILIYHLRGSLNQRGSDLILEGLTGEGAYSIISKIELLGFNQTPAEEQQARLFLSGLQELELTSDIAEQTIQLRKNYKIKLPDAAIAATAIIHQLTLITRNTSDFLRIAGLNIINPFT